MKTINDYAEEMLYENSIPVLEAIAKAIHNEAYAACINAIREESKRYDYGDPIIFGLEQAIGVIGNLKEKK